jgi:hypothetical protein
MAFIDLHPALTGQNTCRWVVGPHLETVTASPAFAALVGTNQDRLAGAPWYVLMTAASRDELERLCESRAESPTATVILRRLRGEPVKVSVARRSADAAEGTTVLAVRVLDAQRR